MHKYNSLFFSVLLFLAACGGDEVPKDVIEPQQMVYLLTQLHIVDGSLYNVTQIPDSLYKYGTAPYSDLFKKFHTNAPVFTKSYKYYTAHPELLQAIYEQVDIALKLKLDSLNKLNQKQMAIDSKRVSDSLKKVTPSQRRADSIKKIAISRKRIDSVRKAMMHNKGINKEKQINHRISI